MKNKADEQEQKRIDLYPLPNSWTWVTVNDAGAYQRNAIVDGPFGSNLKLSDYVESGPVPVLTTKNLEGNYENVRYITKEKFYELRRSAVYPRDILIAKIGSCGKTGIYPSNMPPAMIPANLLKVTLNENYDLKYVYYYFNSSFFQDALKTIIKATAQPAFGVTNFKKLPLPFAPVNEQKSIVAEIEKQFSRLDEAVTALKRIQANLKRYKASVLKAAVEGKLTEEWRKNNKDVEPAEKLLKRILAERKKKWEEKNPGKKYKEPVAPDSSNLPELPKGWVWSNLEQLAEVSPNALKAGPFGSSLKKSYYVPKGYKIYGQEQVLRDDPYFGDYYIDEKRYKMLESCAVKPGDILISLVGTIGRVLILPDKIKPGIINPRLVKVSLDRRLINAKFIKGYLQSPYVKHLFSLASHGGTMDILNLTILKEVPIPLPPREEQNNIIEEIERQFSVDDEIEAAVETNLKRAERLRQAILKKAFGGKLT